MANCERAGKWRNPNNVWSNNFIFWKFFPRNSDLFGPINWLTVPILLFENVNNTLLDIFSRFTFRLRVVLKHRDLPNSDLDVQRLSYIGFSDVSYASYFVTVIDSRIYKLSTWYSFIGKSFYIGLFYLIWHTVWKIHFNFQAASCSFCLGPPRRLLTSLCTLMSLELCELKMNLLILVCASLRS